MQYQKGLRVTLWQEVMNQEGNVVVLKEVVVTITETKTGVPGEFSRNPTKAQSLRGLGDDGKVYEKHWNEWPESQTDDFVANWSVRDDGVEVGGLSFWIPIEAVYAHNRLTRQNSRSGLSVRRVDKDGNDILPKGDVVFCDKHNHYHYKGAKCFECLIQEMRERNVA